MFVRWKRQKRPGHSAITHRRAEKWGDSLRACLVTNTREGQRVKQKVVCYLGSIDEKATGISHARSFFWRRAAPRLGSLNLSEMERSRIETQISKIVPRLSDYEVEQLATIRAKAYGRA